MPSPNVRRQGEWVPLTKAQFRERFYARFYDPAFDAVATELERVFEQAWDGYDVYRKSPRTQPAGAGYADPAMPLPVEWVRTKAAIAAAQARQQDSTSPPAASTPAQAKSPRPCGWYSTHGRCSNRCPTSRSTSSTSRRWPTSR
jgi:hypothetical protein